MSSHPPTADTSQSDAGAENLCSDFKEKLIISEGKQSARREGVIGNPRTTWTSKPNVVQSLVKMFDNPGTVNSCNKVKKNSSVVAEGQVLPSKVMPEKYKQVEKNLENFQQNFPMDHKAISNQPGITKRSHSLHRLQGSELKTYAHVIDIENEETSTHGTATPNHQRRCSDSGGKDINDCAIPHIHRSWQENSGLSRKTKDKQESETAQGFAETSKDAHASTSSLPKPHQALENLSKESDAAQQNGKQAKVESEALQKTTDTSQSALGNDQLPISKPTTYTNKESVEKVPQNKNVQSAECTKALKDTLTGMSQQSSTNHKTTDENSPICGSNSGSDDQFPNEDHRGQYRNAAKTADEYIENKQKVQDHYNLSKNTTRGQYVSFLEKNIESIDIKLLKLLRHFNIIAITPPVRSQINSDIFKLENHDIVNVTEKIIVMIKLLDYICQSYDVKSYIQNRFEKSKQIDAINKSDCDSNIRTTSKSENAKQHSMQQPADQSQLQPSSSVDNKEKCDAQGANDLDIKVTIINTGNVMCKCKCLPVNGKGKTSKCLHCKDQIIGEKENSTSNGTSAASSCPKSNKQDCNTQTTETVKGSDMPNLPRIIISENKRPCKNEKVLLLLGASGSGKTTLIKLIASFYGGVKSPEEYLLLEIKSKIEHMVHQNSVTAYTAYPDDPEEVAITIIDIPGLNDSSGEEIKSRTDALHGFLTDADSHGLKIHAIGFVLQAHISRLTPSEELVMRYVKRHFKVGSTNMFPIVTFADNQKTPPVIIALKESKLNVENFFLFNNSVLSLDDIKEVSEIDNTYWKKGYRNWRKICSLISTFSPVQVLGVSRKKVQMAKPTSHTQLEEQKSGIKKDQSTNTEFEKHDATANCHCSEYSQTKNQSPNTETEGIKKEAESEHLAELKEAIIIFINSADKLPVSTAEREKVWDKASKAYEFCQVKNIVSCDKWLYSFTTEVLYGIRPIKYNREHYLSVLALSQSRPLVHIAQSLVENARDTYHSMFGYYKNTYNIWKSQIEGLQCTANKITLTSIEKALHKYEVDDFMKCTIFLQYLAEEVHKKQSDFIFEVLLKH